MVLGWDIGIKNLAYCNLIETTKEANDFDIIIKDQYLKIILWETVNLADKINEVEVKTTRNILDMLNNDKKLDITKLDSNPTKSIINNVKINNEFNVDIVKKGDKEIKDKKGVKGKKGKQIVIKPVKEEKKKKKKNASKLNLTVLCKTLYNELDTVKDIGNTNLVLLENQPVLKNPTMKSMQMFVYGYFVMKSCKENSPIEDVRCYAASNKVKLVKYASDEFNEKLKIRLGTVKRSYDKNKITAVELVHHFLNHNSSWYIKVYKDSKKKDDLADALLMCIHYIVTTNEKEKKDKEKLEKQEKIKQEKEKKSEIAKEKLAIKEKNMKDKEIRVIKNK